MLSAEDVTNQRFQTVKLREGYDQDQVDEFLDRVADTLRTPVGTPGLTAQDVLGARFAATKFRAGYDQDQVDDFLDVVVQALRERETSAGPAAGPVDAGPVGADWPAPPVGAPQPATSGPIASVVPAPSFATLGPQPVMTAGDLVARLQLVRAARVASASDGLAVRLPDGTVVGVVDLRATPAGIELVAG